MKVKRFLSLVLMFVMVFSLCISANAAGNGDTSDSLNEETKRAYYAEYVKIAKEVSQELDRDISVLPMDEFNDEDWRTPEDFRSFITEVALWRIVCKELEPNDGLSAQAVGTASTTKVANLTADGIPYELLVTGTFETGYNYTYNYAYITGVVSISSALKRGYGGTWTQTGYEFKRLDGFRTAAITVSGSLKVGGARFDNKLAYVEFYCGAVDRVS